MCVRKDETPVTGSGSRLEAQRGRTDDEERLVKFKSETSTGRSGSCRDSSNDEE